MGREWALDCIDKRTQRGLEIGPLATPIVAKADGPVFYVDHADAETLRLKYAGDAHMGTRLHEIVDVDFVLPEGQSLADGLGAEGPFDYVVAAHVIEHVPDVITWLHGIHGLLVPGGILSLVVPDKRFTFDVNRAVTDLSAILDAHHRKDLRPSFGQIYDFSSRTIHGVDARRVWSGEEDYRDVVRTDCPDPHLMAFEFAGQVLTSGEFIDIHCHVFTPASFLEILDRLGHLGLLDYEVASFHATVCGDLEFFVSLRALDADHDAVRDRQRAAMEIARASLRQADRPASEMIIDDCERGSGGMQLSDLERRLVGMKRGAMGRLRRPRRGPQPPADRQPPISA